jgi:magnesium chelatase subunit D
VVDTSPRPQKFVRELAAEMGAKYLPLPYADPKLLSRAVQAEGARRDSQH